MTLLENLGNNDVNLIFVVIVGLEDNLKVKGTSLVNANLEVLSGQ